MTDEAIDVPEANASEEAIPITYSPARNTVFLSLALAWSEVVGVDYSLTVSCYQAEDTRAARRLCESCFLRREGFVNAGIPDPTRYARR